MLCTAPPGRRGSSRARRMWSRTGWGVLYQPVAVREAVIQPLHQALRLRHLLLSLQALSLAGPDLRDATP